jgi:hypothetical protein
MPVGDNKLGTNIWCSIYEGRKVSRVPMCEVRSKGKIAKNQNEKLSIVVNNKNKWIVMNPIWHQMKKCSPSNGQNGQLVHWWLLIHVGPLNSQSIPVAKQCDFMRLFTFT